MWLYFCQFASFIISYPGTIRAASRHTLIPTLSPANANGKLTSWLVSWPVAAIMDPLVLSGPTLGMRLSSISQVTVTHSKRINLYRL